MKVGARSRYGRRLRVSRGLARPRRARCSGALFYLLARLFVNASYGGDEYETVVAGIHTSFELKEVIHMGEHKEQYILNDRDRQLVASAIVLLQKISHAPSVKPSQLVSVGKALHVLTILPDTTEDITLTMDLSGPRRWYGDHEIWHYWQVSIEPNYIEISSGGCFYRQSTGSDTFTCMQWSAQPGLRAEYNDYLNSLWMVDDAQPFEPEVKQIDLSQPGYAIEVIDEDNSLL
jgi:hypothetical protein